MASHSNSSISTFVECQRKFLHNYVLQTPIKKPINPHFLFGTMAHDVLHKAGLMRDVSEVEVRDYDSVIPAESLYPNLKEFFNINNWLYYFRPVCKQVNMYEEKLIIDMLNLEDGDVCIERELKLTHTADVFTKACDVVNSNIVKPFTGVIDLLLLTKNHAMIIDYKFSTSVKDQNDFDINSQLYMYAMLVHISYGIPLKNIYVGYEDIPKIPFSEPVLLKNGTLSRAKSQNVSQEIYIEAVKAIHGEEAEEMLEPGGYYYDIVLELSFKKAAYLTYQYLNLEACPYILQDVIDIASSIDTHEKQNLPYLSRCDAYTCSKCDYLEVCKPWLVV